MLDAAHILPVADGGQHRVDNGILLRRDIHKLFDDGWATITPDYRFKVSRQLKDEVDNGEYYRQFAGGQIWLPPETGNRPGREFLEWHADTRFRG